MATQHIPISHTEEAYLSLIMTEHAKEVAKADARKNEAVNVLLTDKNIPLTAKVTMEARQGIIPAHLVFDDGAVEAVPEHPHEPVPTDPPVTESPELTPIE